MTEIVLMMCMCVSANAGTHTCRIPGCLFQAERTAGASLELSMRMAHLRNSERMVPPGKQQGSPFFHSTNVCQVPRMLPGISLLGQQIWSGFGSQPWNCLIVWVPWPISESVPHVHHLSLKSTSSVQHLLALQLWSLWTDAIAIDSRNRMELLFVKPALHQGPSNTLQ